VAASAAAAAVEDLQSREAVAEQAAEASTDAAVASVDAAVATDTAQVAAETSVVAAETSLEAEAVAEQAAETADAAAVVALTTDERLEQMMELQRGQTAQLQRLIDRETPDQALATGVQEVSVTDVRTTDNSDQQQSSSGPEGSGGEEPSTRQRGLRRRAGR